MVSSESSSSSKSVFNNYSSNKYVSGAKEFLSSNSLVAKFVFLILILFLFILAIRIGGTILAYIFTPSKNPVLIGGMVDGTQSKQFSANPNDNNSVLIMRSANKRSGMEYTWSTWIYVEDGAISDGYKHIFHKGNHNIVSEDSSSIGRAYVGTNAPNNGPGLYIQPNINNLEVIVSTFNNPKNSIVVEDIPLNKWINVILRLENNTFDVYINGSIIRRHIFDSGNGGDVVFQNYGDVYANQNGGFSGYQSDLRYFDHAIPINHIQQIVSKGPNTTSITEDTTMAKPRYLSTRWYFAGNEDGYNP